MTKDAFSGGTGGRDAGYRVGYGRPPRHARFQKGESGNPTGRPKKKRRSTAELLAQELDRKIPVTEGGRLITISKRSAFVKSLVARAIKGDARAATQVLKFIETLETEELPNWPGAASGTHKAFPMTDEEWYAKRGPDPTHAPEPDDYDRMTDEQIQRGLLQMRDEITIALREYGYEGDGD